MYKLLLTTLRGLEKIAAEHIREIIPSAIIDVKPYGFSGILLVSNVEEIEEAVKLIREKIPEVEKIFPILAQTEANIEKIVEETLRVVVDKISANDTFAVRTRRRGSHNFTSIDVNIQVGAAVREATGAEVDLNYPSKIVWIDILEDLALISVTDGKIETKKITPDKPWIRDFLRKISLVQVPYDGPSEACYRVGVRIGRAVQTFEIGEIVVAPFKTCSGESLYYFLKGLLEGIESRYKIQLKTYPWKPRKVKVNIQDLYQLVRDRRGEPIIATSTRGEVIVTALERKAEYILKGKRISILVGAREGLPTGVFRFSTITVDLSPGVTLPTDFAGFAAIISMITVFEKLGLFPQVGAKSRK